ncbi:hypothetical protein SpiGrapes_1860 [Sphaerochaeta pleomorpha str. Grapes]|uniref:Uncharacterized protein n=1 Tax=Sphaerochaeta pleomorpha (strain ATCC BAA-1885 / DSM 22778 / Grapes) TaxID=158190 RepID=G8QY89_SPHPG|nr:hypothetical protein [Sphaerochaeta pleomorpha]AEV29654.1 hypothetical protein SpiGrapes_1860 [Sphaerochaeta pleomorpha str. Grapes]
MKIQPITNVTQLSQVVDSLGFLPFFPNSIEGFSLKEATPREYWFVKGVEGPWEWKEQIAKEGIRAYAKLFNGKAGFVSSEWYPYLANYRRGGDDFQTCYQKGRVGHKEKLIFDALQQKGPLLSSELKYMFGKSGFDQAVTKLQMKTFVTNMDFEYKTDRFGKSYGWGIALFSLSEEQYGEDFLVGQSDLLPDESFFIMLTHLSKQLGSVFEKEIARILR